MHSTKNWSTLATLSTLALKCFGAGVAVAAAIALSGCDTQKVAVDPAQAQSNRLVAEPPTFSGRSLHLRRFTEFSPGCNIISMTTKPASVANPNLFVTLQEGQVFELKQPGDRVQPVLWFDYDRAIADSFKGAGYRPTLDLGDAKHGGLRSVAFHPLYAQNGKFYTSAMVKIAPTAEGLHYLGPKPERVGAESLLAEWTFDLSTNTVEPGSYRELFRIRMRKFDHPIKEIAFNDVAEPGDVDYGLLYVTHGDGSPQAAATGGGQSLNDALGKVLRINPLATDLAPYSTPHSPFANSPDALAEIFTYGHRNPHTLSFARGSDGTSHAIVADTGRDNIEEINLLQAGGNFGWSLREGTFVHNQRRGRKRIGYGLGYGVDLLPSDESLRHNFIYPAAQYAHVSEPNRIDNGAGITGGYVVTNPASDLLGHYLLADFVKLGHVFSVEFERLLKARTSLKPGDSPAVLRPAVLERLPITLDSDADGTIDARTDTLTELFGSPRTDVRFGRGSRGKIFLSSKVTGVIYVVVNALEPP